MGDWPISKQYAPGLYSGFNASSTVPKTVTRPASIDTKGSWTQLTTSVGKVSLILLDVLFVAGSSTNYLALLDIGIGPSGSQVVLVPNLLFTATATYSTDWVCSLAIPVKIPPGTAIWARYQCSSVTGSPTLYCGVRLVESGFMPSAPLNRVTAYGVSESVPTYGVQLTSGAANTEGSWTQVVASTNNTIEHLLAFFWSSDSNSAHYHAITIGIGADPNQITVVDKIWSNRQSLKAFVPIHIPPGTTLWAKYQCTGATQTGYIALYGVD